MNYFDLSQLDNTQKKLRKKILDISYNRSLSHLGSCLSAVDIIESIYQHKKQNEAFILSCGHAAIAWYVVLEQHGLLPADKISTLNIHPDRNPSYGISVSTGSLGQGLPIAAGLALADRSLNTYCLISDGECYEGSIWESLQFASEQNLNNLKIILSANSFRGYGQVNLYSLRKRLKSFGYHIILMDGHNISDIKNQFATRIKKPTIYFAITTVEQFEFLQGVSAHYHKMSEQDYKKACKELI